MADAPDLTLFHSKNLENRVTEIEKGSDKIFTASSSFGMDVHAYRRNGVGITILPGAKTGVQGNQYLEICTVDSEYKPKQTVSARVYDTNNALWLYYEIGTNGTCRFYAYTSSTLARPTNTNLTTLVYPL